MKSTGGKSFETAATTSTTGPHVRDVQNFGVANTTTNGLCAAIESATDQRRRSRSGGVRVVSVAMGASPSFGVSERGAGDPTAGDAVFAFTSTCPSACTAAPRGSATIQ